MGTTSTTSTTRARKASLLGLLAGAAVLTMAAAAFACTEMRGKVTISAVNGTGSATYQGNGGDPVSDPTGWGYCGGLPSSRVPLNATAATLQFKLDVQRASCAGAAALPAGTYDVRWVKAEDAIDTTWPYPTCEGAQVDPNNPGNGWVKVGQMSVASSGTSSGTFNLALAQQGPGNICLSNQNTTSNNIAPPHVFMKWNVI